MLKLIKTNVLDTAAASVTIDNIPQEFKSLKLIASPRFSGAFNFAELRISFNGSATSFSWRRLQGNGSNVFSDANTTYGSPYNQFILSGSTNAANSTSNTFGSFSVDISNYTSSANKVVSSSLLSENNANEGYQNLVGGLWSNSAVVTSISLSTNGGNFVAGSTFYLYGIA